MWRDTCDAHEAGQGQITEIRASDSVGPDLDDSSHLADRFVPPILARKTARVLGRAWHVPTLSPLSARQIGDAFATAAGTEAAKVARIPRFAVKTMALVMPLFRTLLTMTYQFDEPFVIDSADTTETFGIEPTPLDEQVRATLASYRADVATTASA